MTGIILMIVGGTTWLVGELWGVHRKAKGDTTSEFVWYLEARYPILRVFVGVFCASLLGHFLFGTPLLP